jgi:hypothetical protein
LNHPRSQTTETQGQSTPAYNYSEFAPSRERDLFSDWPALVPVGKRPPDFTATLLDDGSTVSLSDYVAKGPVTMEFGSLT